MATAIILSLFIWWVVIIGTLIMQRISEAWRAYTIYAAVVSTLFTLFISWYCYKP